MTNDIDIWSAADFLMKRHGADLAIVAPAARLATTPIR